MTSKIHFNITNKIGSLESTLKSQRELLEVNPNLAFTEFTKDVLATYPEKIRKFKKFADLKNFWTFTPTAKDFKEFVGVLVKNNINFHPEDDFNDYTNPDGSKTFPNEHIAIIVNDNFDIARDTLSEEVFWKICRDVRGWDENCNDKKDKDVIKVIPITYLKFGFIVITSGYKVLINGTKYPRQRGHIYTSFKNTKDTVKKLALKEYQGER